MTPTDHSQQAPLLAEDHSPAQLSSILARMDRDTQARTILGLQRAQGNAFVQSMLGRSPAPEATRAQPAVASSVQRVVADPPRPAPAAPAQQSSSSGSTGGHGSGGAQHGSAIADGLETKSTVPTGQTATQAQAAAPADHPVESSSAASQETSARAPGAGLPGQGATQGVTGDASLSSLIAVQPSSLGLTVEAVAAAAPGLQAHETAQLAASLPVVDAPSGLPVRAAPGAPPTPSVGLGDVPDVPAASGRAGQPFDTRHPSPGGPLPGAQVSTAVAATAADSGDGGWLGSLMGRLRSFLAKVPTQDPHLVTSPGAHPGADLSGEATPAQATQAHQRLSQHVRQEHAHANTAAHAYFGQNELYPTVPAEPARADVMPGSPTALAAGGAPVVSDAPEEARAVFNRQAGRRIHGRISALVEPYQRERSDYQEQSAALRDQHHRAIEAESQRARGEQKSIQLQAREQIGTQQRQWQAENQTIQHTFASQSETKKAEVEREVGRHIKEADQRATAELSSAEAKAEAEKHAAEQQAIEAKRQAESRPASAWERLKGAVSSALESVKSTVTGIFQKLRETVSAIIEKAKTIARDVLEAARAAVVKLVGDLRDALKSLASAAVSALRNLANRAYHVIRQAIRTALDAINAIAAALKRAITGLLNALAGALARLLAAIQAVFNAVLTGIRALAQGVVRALEMLRQILDFQAKLKPILKIIMDLVKDPSPVVNKIKELIGGMMAQVPVHAEAALTQVGKSGKVRPSHLEGIKRHLLFKLDAFMEHWWDIVTDAAYLLLVPWGKDSSGQRPLVNDVTTIYHSTGDAISDVGKGEFSKATDDILRAMQALNGVVGLFSGWMFVGLVGGGALVGGLVGGAFTGGVAGAPGAVAGAGWGLGMAATIGFGMLAAAAAVEAGVLIKASIDLAAAPDLDTVPEAQQEEQSKRNEFNYGRIANSAVSLGVMGAVWALSEIAARVARAAFTFVARRIPAVARFVRKVVGKPPVPQAKYGAVSDKHVVDHGHAADGKPPVTDAGATKAALKKAAKKGGPAPGPIFKSKFKPGEGGQKFTDEVMNHPNVKKVVQPDGRVKFSVDDLGRITGTGRAGENVRGGTVIQESPTPGPHSSTPPNEVVTQFPSGVADPGSRPGRAGFPVQPVTDDGTEGDDE